MLNIPPMSRWTMDIDIRAHVSLNVFVFIFQYFQPHIFETVQISAKWNTTNAQEELISKNCPSALARKCCRWHIWRRTYVWRKSFWYGSWRLVGVYQSRLPAFTPLWLKHILWMSFSIRVNNLQVESYILDVKISTPYYSKTKILAKTRDMFVGINILDILVSYLNWICSWIV